MNKTPQSKLNWQKKYDKEKMEFIGIKCSKEEKQLYSNISQKYNLKLATFIRKCVIYCIENNIDLSEMKKNKDSASE